MDDIGDCLHGCRGAVAIFNVEGGCVAWPNVKTQVLCWQHSGSLDDGAYGKVTLLQDLTPGWFNRWWYK